MSVVRLLLAYDGTDFHGWARQPALRTVQGTLEDALAPLFGGAAPELTVAGRTDAGVHAWGQVASLVVPSHMEPRALQRAVNARLAPEVVVRSARWAADGFDARYSAVSREYVYAIDTASVPSPFTARFVMHRPGVLAVGAMRRAARHLVGKHDFASFCRRPDPPAGTVRRLEALSVAAAGTDVTVRVRANAFCHQMVRSLVGTLVRVGDGRLDPSDVAGILRAADRAAAPFVAPPHGLILMRVRYPRGGTGSAAPARSTFDAPEEPQVN
jgi:tRNA pseudouridine38-40 synthase